MTKDTPSPPPAPDPSVTAAAQTQSNQQTGLYNFGLNNPNVVTPLGSSTYTQTGGGPQYNMDAYNKALAAYNAGGGGGGGQSQWYNNDPSTGIRVDSNGNPVTSRAGLAALGPANRGGGSNMPKLSDFLISDNAPPQFTQNITLSPEQQQLYNQNTAQSIKLSNLASQLQGNVGNALNQPGASSADFATASKQAQDAYYKNQTQYLDPQWSQAQELLDSKLANQGITSGSEAYNNENNNFARQKQAAYDTAQQNAIIAGPQNAQQLFALSTAAREQPLNEFNALRSQSQVQMPQFQGTQPSTVAPTNVAGITQQAYQNSLNPYNAQIAANNQMTGGLFGLGGSALGAAGSWAGSSAGSAALASIFSDVRLKENVKYIGHEKGYAIYHFNYIADPEKLPYRGVIAQEIMGIMPSAVIDNGNYLMVDYAQIGIEFARVH